MDTPQDLPFDILPPILENLDRKDLYAATLVNKAFHRAATPLLYASLDSRIIQSNKASKCPIQG